MKKLLSLLSVLTISGTTMPNVIAASNYERNVNTKKLNRTKRENIIDNDFSFVEKIYDKDDYTWSLSLVLSKYNWEQIINIFIKNNKSNFILKTKKIITEIKNNSLNLSAKVFDEGNIDAFSHHIWNNQDYYKSLINLKNKELIKINLYIENNQYIKDQKLAWIINSISNFDFVEKIYDKDDYTWSLSLVLSKYNWEQIINTFIKNNKSNFILKTKKIITEIKNNSLNLSAKVFDEGNIDAFSHHIWNNFNQYYNLAWNLNKKQLVIFYLNIDKRGNYVKDDNFVKFIGDKNRQQIKFQNEIKTNTNYLLNNTIKRINLCNENNDKKIIEKNNAVEKWYNDKIKIKINKITYFKINMLFFLIKDRSIFIEKLTALFSTFSSVGNYSLNTEDIKSFAYLIWKNFSTYYDAFLKLKNDESIRMTSYAGYPHGYWTNDDFEKYNEIVEKNNAVIDWQIFNDRKIKIETQKQKVLTSHDDEFKRKKRPNDESEPQPGPSKQNLSNVIKNVVLGSLPNNNPETILDAVGNLNPSINLDEVEIVYTNLNCAVILTKKGSQEYKPSLTNVYFVLPREIETPLASSETLTHSSDRSLIFTNLTENDSGRQHQEINDIFLTNMHRQMQPQEKNDWCMISILQNILVNTDSNYLQLFDQMMTYDLAQKSLSNIDISEGGIPLPSLSHIINENLILRGNINYQYSYVLINNDFFKKILVTDFYSLLQTFILNSLLKKTPVVVGYDTLNKKTKKWGGHSVLIVGIEPNQDPSKDLFIIRDPSLGNIPENKHFLPISGEPNTERIINIQNIISGNWFDVEYQISDLLINKDVFNVFLNNLINNFENIRNHLFLNKPIDFVNSFMNCLSDFLSFYLNVFPDLIKEKFN